MFMGPQNGTCFISAFWRKNFAVASGVLENLCVPSLGCDAMYFGEQMRMFQNNQLPQSLIGKI